MNRKTLLTTLLTLSCFTICIAQESPQEFVFEGNNFRWTQTTNGSLFYKELQGLPGLEVPVGSGNHSIFTATLWVAGLSDDNEVRASFRRFCQNDNENCYQNWGPLKINGALSTSSEVETFNHIWFVSQDQIDDHLDYHLCLNDPNCDESVQFPDYEIPEDFMSWPAEGQDGFAENLAPFADFNGDGTYSPQLGDYPAICGDFSSYAIWNDLGANGASSDGNEIGLELHTTVYGYNNEIESDFNTLYVKHKLIHRGEEIINDTYTGFWTDFDLGNPVNDRLRTDVERKLFYVYNGHLNDGPSGSGPGYGDDLPAMAVKVLAGPNRDPNGLDDLPEYSSNYGGEATGWNDGVIDNERLGLTSSMFHQGGGGPTATQTPSGPSEFHNAMKAIWRDGTPQIYGGVGWDTISQGLTVTDYCLPGISDPFFSGSGGVAPNYPFSTGWTEENEEFPASDRRMVGSSGPFTFSPGDVQYIDLAYIFARESFDEDETVIETLQRFADEVEGRQCSPLPAIVLSNGELVERKELKLFPNPAQNFVAFELPLEQATMTLFDITGKEIRQSLLQGGSQQLDVSELGNGLYLIRIESANSIYQGKFVVKN